MSFNQEKITKVSDQASEIFDTYIYSTDDSADDTEVAGYFAACRFASTEPDRWIGGRVIIKCAGELIKGFINSVGDFVKFIPAGAFCPIMTFTELFAVNSSGVFTGMQLTVTNDGVGAGQNIQVGDTDWIATTGKVSFEVKFNSSTDLNGCVIGIALIQGATFICGAGLYAGTGEIEDLADTSILETVAVTVGQFVIGITLDQDAGTATYSRKLTDAASPSANAAITVDAGYVNTDPITLVMVSHTADSGVNVSTGNSGNAAFVTNVDGLGYCEF